MIRLVHFFSVICTTEFIHLIDINIFSLICTRMFIRLVDFFCYLHDSLTLFSPTKGLGGGGGVPGGGGVKKKGVGWWGLGGGWGWGHCSIVEKL